MVENGAIASYQAETAKAFPLEKMLYYASDDQKTTYLSSLLGYCLHPN